MNELFKENLKRLTSSHSEEELKTKRFLLAISGGADSVCMASLFALCGLSYSIAHVNFGLRGKESDGDEKLVREWAKRHNAELFVYKPETKKFAAEKSLSLQMAARELRYNWFFSLAENGYDYIAVAHNLNDNAETLILNLVRGTGIKGICGIPEINGKIIRPLMKFTREEIYAYLKKNRISHREDHTNKEDHYSRNRIRNRVFPELAKINPNFLSVLDRDIDNFRSAADVLEEIKQDKLKSLSAGSDQKSVTSERPLLTINISALKRDRNSKFWLYEILSGFGFNSGQTSDLFGALDSTPGKVFNSKSHTLVKDRSTIMVFTISKGHAEGRDNTEHIVDYENFEFTPDGNLEYVTVNPGIRFRLFRKPDNFSPLSGPGVHYLDASEASFPLTVRRWREGDRFIPLGMKNFKKVSDFYSDLKIDIHTKQFCNVITKNGQIVCLPGFRIDDRFRVTENTAVILELSIIY
jgi:tRNA(Ile)-lysidine synthase